MPSPGGYSQSERAPLSLFFVLMPLPKPLQWRNPNEPPCCAAVFDNQSGYVLTDKASLFVRINPMMCGVHRARNIGCGKG